MANERYEFGVEVTGVEKAISNISKLTGGFTGLAKEVEKLSNSGKTFTKIERDIAENGVETVSTLRDTGKGLKLISEEVITNHQKIAESTRKNLAEQTRAKEKEHRDTENYVSKMERLHEQYQNKVLSLRKLGFTNTPKFEPALGPDYNKDNLAFMKEMEFSLKSQKIDDDKVEKAVKNNAKEQREKDTHQNRMLSLEEQYNRAKLALHKEGVSYDTPFDRSKTVHENRQQLHEMRQQLVDIQKLEAIAKTTRSTNADSLIDNNLTGLHAGGRTGESRMLNQLAQNKAIEELRKVSAESNIPLNEQRKILMDLAKGAYPQVTSANAAYVSQAHKTIETIKATNGGFGGMHSMLQKNKELWNHLVGTFTGFAMYQGIYNLVYNIKDAIKATSELSIKLAEVQTIATSPETADRGRLEATTAAYSKKYNITPEQMAKSEYETLSNQMAQGADTFTFLSSAIDFSKASVTSLDNSVDILTATLNAYGMTSAQVEPVAAALFETIYMGRVRADEMSSTIGRLLIMSNELGISYQETLASIAALTIQGTKYSESLTFTRNFMMAMIKPGKDMKELYQALGVATPEAAIATYQFAGMLNEVEKAAQGSSKELAALFPNIRGFMGAAGLTKPGYAKALEDIRHETERYREAINIRMNDPGEKFQKELNAIRTEFMNTFGRTTVDLLGSTSGHFFSLSNMVKITTTSVITLGAAFAGGHFLGGVKAALTHLSMFSARLKGVQVEAAMANASVKGGVAALFGAGLPGAVVGGIALLITTYKSLDTRVNEAIAELTIVSDNKIKEANRELAQMIEMVKAARAANLSDELKPMAEERKKLSADIAAKQEELVNGLEHQLNLEKQSIAVKKNALSNDKTLAKSWRESATEAGTAVRELQAEVDKLTTKLEESQNAFEDIGRSESSERLERMLSMSGANPYQKFQAYIRQANELAGRGRVLTYDGDMKNARQTFEEARSFLDKAFNESGGRANIEGYYNQLSQLRKEAELFEQTRIHTEGDPKADELATQKEYQDYATAQAEELDKSIESQTESLQQQQAEYEKLRSARTDILTLAKDENATVKDLEEVMYRINETEDSRNTFLDQILEKERGILEIKERVAELDKEVQARIEKNKSENEALDQRSNLENALSTDAASINNAMKSVTDEMLNPGLVAGMADFFKTFSLDGVFSPYKGKKPYQGMTPAELIHERAKEEALYTSVQEQYKALNDLGKQGDSLPQDSDKQIEYYENLIAQIYRTKTAVEDYYATDSAAYMNFMKAINGEGDRPGALDTAIQMKKRIEALKANKEITDPLMAEVNGAQQLNALRVTGGEYLPNYNQLEGNLAEIYAKQYISKRDLNVELAKNIELMQTMAAWGMGSPVNWADTSMYGGGGGSYVPYPQRLATGGPIGGPQGTDTVPAWLTPGEFVINRESSQKYGDIIRAINDGTLYLAGGGDVPHRYQLEYLMMKMRHDLGQRKRKSYGELYRDRGNTINHFYHDDDQTIRNTFYDHQRYYQRPQYQGYQSQYPNVDQRVFYPFNNGYSNWNNGGQYGYGNLWQNGAIRRIPHYDIYGNMFSKGGAVGSFAKRPFSKALSFARTDSAVPSVTTTTNQNDIKIISTGNTRTDAKRVIASINREQSRGGARVNNSTRRRIM